MTVWISQVAIFLYDESIKQLQLRDDTWLIVDGQLEKLEPFGLKVLFCGPILKENFNL